MNARVLIIVVAAGVIAALTVAGVMLLLVVALFTRASFQVSQEPVLPESELARPPEADYETAVTAYVTRAGTVLIGDRESSVDEAPSLLLEQLGQLDEGQSVTDITVLIRADPDTRTATVHELIKAFQAAGFERFKLRAAE